MDVTIDGTTYVPAHTERPHIGVAVTTRNRRKTLEHTLHEIRAHTPDAHLVIVDDASDKPVDAADHRFETQAGIVAAKNKCLELLMDAGCEHLFLFDDDAYPLVDDWWRPYTESAEPHLAYQFLDLAGPRKLRDLTEIHRDPQHVAYTGQRGVMLYYHRTAIEQVGGFDPIYGLGMYEHSDLANRIYHAGLTTWRYADIVGSSELIYSLDEHEETSRSLSDGSRRDLVRDNAAVHNRRRQAGHTGYVEYREQHDAVITTLLTSQTDPQRGKRWKPDPNIIAAWARSLRHEHAVVLADELDPTDGIHVHAVPPLDGNPYQHRWLHIYRHLREHPEYRYVWCTDGSDVVMLRPPWDGMDDDFIYAGSEPKTLDDTWMRNKHPAERYQQFINRHRHHAMLNAGLLGGHRTTVMEFAHHMIREHHDLAAERFWGSEPDGVEVGDMAAFNRVAYTIYGDRLMTGPQVHTVFRANDTDNQWAWWKHR